MSTLHNGTGGLNRTAGSERVSVMALRRSTLSLVFVCSTLYVALPGSFLFARNSSNEAQAQHAPTAGDQKNNSSDVRLAARIRKAIVSDKNLSTSAHNVKIIVRNGSVTLRGEVDSDQEKISVLQKAEQIAGANAVRDLLTVKRK